MGFAKFSELMRAEYIGKSLEEDVGKEEGTGRTKVVVIVQGLEGSCRGEGGVGGY